MRTIQTVAISAILFATSIPSWADTPVNYNAGGVTDAIAELDAANLPDISQGEMDATRGEAAPIVVIAMLTMTAVPVVWDIYFNQGRNSIYYTARTLKNGVSWSDEKTPTAWYL